MKVKQPIRVLVGQSGGPTAVINASLYGVLSAALESELSLGSPIEVFGMIYGLEGYLKGMMYDFSSLSEEKRPLLKTTPGSFLGSCRYKLPEDMADPLYGKIFEAFEKDRLDIVLYIGGNDSMDTVNKLSAYAAEHEKPLRIVGIPKTIDNDLPITDHSPGFPSAAKFVASLVRGIVRDAEVYDLPAVTLVEVMGRHAGWLTAACAAARVETEDNPVLLYLPEADFSVDSFITDIERQLEKRKALVVCLSEGIHLSDGTLLCEMAGEAGHDVFGHKQLSGAAKVLEGILRARLSIKVRSIELNVPQRCNAVEASLTDVSEAMRCGSFGLESALSGETGKAVVMTRKEEGAYGIDYALVPASMVGGKEKSFPASWITKGGSDVSDQFLEYLRPLLIGESRPPMKDGLPVYLTRD